MHKRFPYRGPPRPKPVLRHPLTLWLTHNSTQSTLFNPTYSRTGGVWVWISKHHTLRLSVVSGRLICRVTASQLGARSFLSSLLPLSLLPGTDGHMSSWETCGPAVTPLQGTSSSPTLFLPGMVTQWGLPSKKQWLHKEVFHDHQVKLQIHSHRAEELIYQLLLSQEVSDQYSAWEQGDFDMTLHSYPSRA